MNRTSILGRVHAEGYRDGWSQAAQIGFDDAFDEGRTEGWSQGARVSAWKRFAWFLFGLACGTIFGMGIAG